MDKAAEAFRTISEVAIELDVPKHVLRFWEGKFPQVKPMKLGGGRRYYRPDDVVLLQGIRRLLYEEGYTIKGVQKVIRDHGLDFVKATGLEGKANNQTPDMERLAGSSVNRATVAEPAVARANSKAALSKTPASEGARSVGRTPARRAPQTGIIAKPPAVDTNDPGRQSVLEKSGGARRAPRAATAAPAVVGALLPDHAKRLRQARRELEICLHLLASDQDEEEQGSA